LKEKDNNRNILNEEVLRFFAISFGVFLFILFFQPFPLESLDYENRLLFVTGFGIITFVSSFMIFIVLPYFLPNFIKEEIIKIPSPILLSILLFFVTTVSYFFYIRYAGGIYLSLYIMFKIVLVCLLPIIIVSILYKNKSLQSKVDGLEKKNQVYLFKMNAKENPETEDEIIITSENGIEKFPLKLKDLVCIKSSDNYIEIYHVENEIIKMKLIRSTLKKTNLQLSKSRNIVRCHRTCLVNILYIEKLARNYSGHFIKIKNSEITLPVSRQYYSSIKILVEKKS
jgi:hypothetical protein